MALEIKRVTIEDIKQFTKHDYNSDIVNWLELPQDAEIIGMTMTRFKSEYNGKQYGAKIYFKTNGNCKQARLRRLAIIDEYGDMEGWNLLCTGVWKSTMFFLLEKQ